MHLRNQTLFLLVVLMGHQVLAASSTQEWVRVSPDRTGFVLEPSGRAFHPRGFNYDHNNADVLIEDYWDQDWASVVQDFGEMKQLGANLVRIHFQVGRVLKSAEEADERFLKRLQELLALSEKLGLYLDLTGLGCYHKQDVPAWYDALDEPQRWKVQARFWTILARECRNSPAVFCYDLMNEPVVPGLGDKRADWLGPPFAGKHFVQFITRETRDRKRTEVARAWIRILADAIRREDKRHLITVGLVDWSLDRPGLTSGFVPSEIAAELDFVSVHLYPERGKLEEALTTLKGFNVGKPVLIEETFPLRTSVEEFKQFALAARPHAAGWLGFYWGKTLEESREGSTMRDGIMAQWLEFFKEP